MFQPDFEEIRKKAISDMLENTTFRNQNDKKMAEVFAQSASIVASNMIAEYHRQLMDYIKKDR